MLISDRFIINATREEIVVESICRALVGIVALHLSAVVVGEARGPLDLSREIDSLTEALHFMGTGRLTAEFGIDLDE